MHCIKNKVSGNDACVDCGAPSEWIFVSLVTAQLITCVRYDIHDYKSLFQIPIGPALIWAF